MDIMLIKNRHILVKQNEDVLQNENGNWLILDLIDNNMCYITPTLEVLNFFNIKTTDCDKANESTDCESTSESMKKLNEVDNIKENNKENCAVRKWDRNAILSFIELCKENYKILKVLLY